MDVKTICVELSDEILMNRVKEGNLQDLAILFERYHVLLFNLFLKHTAKKDVSQDLTQNLFYRILKYRSSYKSENSFKSWIYQMARNVHIDYCKRNQKDNERFSQVDEHNPNIPEINDEAFSEDDFGRLDKALSQLDNDQREVLILSRYQGLKYEEISKINNTSVSAIKVQVHRAIKQLRCLYFNLIDSSIS
jgi:RNA polymerase sigma-70 factor (ECF subfamily)